MSGGPKGYPSASAAAVAMRRPCDCGRSRQRWPVRCAPAFSQIAGPNEMHFPYRSKLPATPPVPPNTPMLVQADEIKYDYPTTRRRRRPRADLLRRRHHRGGSGRLRPKNQAAARRGKCQADRGRTAASPTGKSSISPTIIATGLSIRLRSRRRTIPVSPRSAPTARRAITRCCKTASIPPANPARIIRRNRPSGRSRRLASFTMMTRR